MQGKNRTPGPSWMMITEELGMRELMSRPLDFGVILSMCKTFRYLAPKTLSNKLTDRPIQHVYMPRSASPYFAVHIRTVLLTINILVSSVAFHGPVYLSGPSTGQYWHPPSGSLIPVLSPKWGETSRKAFSPCTVRSSAVGNTSGDAGRGESRQVTAKRVRSPW